MTGSNGQPDATAAAVAGLAREVEALRHLVEHQAGLGAQVDQLAGLVAELAETTSTRTPARPTTWLAAPLDDPDDAELVLAGLVEWMRTVYLRYTDAARSLPACWLWHPDVVEELLWLMQAWQAAYESKKGTAWQAADWHDRYRPGVARRVRAAAGTCSPEAHCRPRTGQAPGGPPVVPLVDAVEPLAGWWASARHEVPPEPTAEQLRATAARGGGRR